MRKFLFILPCFLALAFATKAQINQPFIPNSLNPAFVGYGDSLQITTQAALDNYGFYDQALNMNMNLGKGFVLALTTQFSRLPTNLIGLQNYLGQNLSFIKRLKIGKGRLGIGLQGTASSYQVSSRSDYEAPLYRNFSLGATYERANYLFGVGVVGLLKQEWLTNSMDSIRAHNATAINGHMQTNWKYRNIQIQPHMALAYSHFNEKLSYNWLNLGVAAKWNGFKAGIDATNFRASLNTRLNIGYDWKHFSAQYFITSPLPRLDADFGLGPNIWTQGLTLRYHLSQRASRWRLF